MNLTLLKVVMFHKGQILIQIKSLLMLSLMISPLTWVMDKLLHWQLQNESYVGFVVGAIVVDHLLGIIYHAFYARDFSMKKNISGLLRKLVIVVTVGYLFEGLDHLMTADSILKDYTVMVLRLMVFLYPAGSAFTNSYLITGKKFPPLAFMTKLKEFSKSATINNNAKV